MDAIRSIDPEVMIPLLAITGGLIGLAMMLTLGAMLCLALYKGYKRIKEGTAG